MELKKYKLGDLVEVTRGMSLSGQFYSETGTLIRLTLGNFNMNGGGFKENTSKTDLYFTGPVKEEYILQEGDIITPLTEQSLGLLGTTAKIPESGKYIQSNQPHTGRTINDDIIICLPDSVNIPFQNIFSPHNPNQLQIHFCQSQITR